MLFNFTLAPLERIEPWGFPEEYRLHWFGLTEGEYWLEAGDSRLLEYSEQARREDGMSRYCEYQVARLYEDVMEMAPDVLEPVPAALVRCISGESGRRWWEMFCSWYADREDDPPMDIVGAVNEWRRKRLLDTLYLTPGANIYLWSDEAMVHIEWDNRGELIGGRPAWSAECGSWELRREDFENEVRSFHERLMEQMGERVEAVAGGALRALRPEVYVDLEQLQNEHRQRCGTMERAFSAPRVPEDWGAVEEAVREVERGRRGGG
ncbi:MAG TPA: DUF5984 family protein [Verrucomicrobiales bacterium]|nr:DUF5984 family protein [Verrucomicrobiales bacterium]